MHKSNDTVEQKLRVLRDKYAKQLGEKVSRIEDTWNRLEQNIHDGAAWEEFHQLTHSLAGSGATFGFAGVSKLAHALEVFSGEILDDGPPTTDAPLLHIGGLLSQLVRSAAEPERAVEIVKPELHPRQGKMRGEHTVLIIDGDLDQAQALGSQVSGAGYAVRISTQPEEALEEIADAAPAAILLSIVFPGGRDLGLQVANQIRQTHQGRIPVVFTSTRQGFETRLAAARAGGAGYFVKPLHIGKLVDRLDQVIARRSLGPHRVLIVCDNPDLAATNASALANVGMAVQIATDASTVPDQMRDFEPELILVNHVLPSCTGLELARVIRQQHTDAGLPIVFLVPNQETVRAFLHMGLDEEDFVLTDASPDNLILLITRRVVRARSVRSALIQDNLAKVLEDGSEAELKLGAGSSPDAGRVVPTPTRPRPKVLVVDDDEYILEAIAIKLENQGMEVWQSTGGVEGYRLAYLEDPDVIVTDYNMPEGSGDYLLSRLKANLSTRDTPVVVVTGRTFGGRKDYAVERDMLGRRGAAAYLIKPLNLDALVEVVQRHAGLTTT